MFKFKFKKKAENYKLKFKINDKKILIFILTVAFIVKELAL